MSERDSSDQSLRKLTEDLTSLIEASSVLAGSLKLENVLPHTLDLCRSLITADAYAVWLYSRETSKWSIVSSSGLSDEYQRLAFEVLDHSTPLLDQPMVIDDPDNSKILERHRDIQRREGIKSLLVIPLRIGGQISGTVVFYYRKPHRISDAEVRIGTGIGNLVGASISSIRNCEKEAALRRQAEKARQRAAFLADLSAVLSQTLDLQTTLDKVVRLAISAIPQSCKIYFRDESGDFFPLTMAHENPEKEILMKRFAQSYQPASNPNSQVKRAYETRESVLIAEVAPHHLSGADRDRDASVILRAIDPKSIMIVPLVARGKSIGVMTFGTSDGSNKYTEDDLKFAQQIALHAAWMVDNARLYSEVLKADARKDQFLAMLGHELRNPLTPVRTGIEILNSPGATPRQHEDTIAIIQRQVAHMSRIVDDLLDVSRIRFGRMDFKKESVDLVRIIEGCAGDYRPVFEQMKIRFSARVPSQPMWVSADSVRISQAIGNLLNNASKFTPEGSEVLLELTLKSDSEALVSIKDKGVGIPAETIPRLFEVFSQAEMGIDRSKGGLGVGLVLVKGLIEGHGGKVAARSLGTGMGAEFIITLPLITPAPVHPASADSTRKCLGRRILIIEDNADVAATMGTFLSLFGHTVAIARNGVDGIEKFPEFGPQVVLCDIGLPGGMDGLAVARALRKLDARIKLVALTGYGSETDQQRSLDAGFDEHFTKPVDLKRLQNMLTTSVPAV